MRFHIGTPDASSPLGSSEVRAGDDASSGYWDKNPILRPLSMLSAGRRRVRTLDLLSGALVYSLDVLNRKGELVWAGGFCA